MICNIVHLENEQDSRGWKKNFCTRCLRVIWSPYHPSTWAGDPIICRATPASEMPAAMAALRVQSDTGDQLHALIFLLGVTPDASCGCEAMRQQMNRWGPEGCQANRGAIIEHLKKAYSTADWPTVIRAGALALSQRLPLTLDGLLDEAIRRSSTPSAKATPALPAPKASQETP